MGYYANGYGSLMLVNEADWTENQKKEMLRHLNATDVEADVKSKLSKDLTLEALLEEVLPLGFGYSLLELCEDYTEVTVFLDEKYHEDDWKEFLSVIAPVALKDSQIEFLGEDSQMWRFICLKDGNGFVDQQGHVVYE